jgi:toxin CptA
MHSAPAVSYPVGRSSFYGTLLVGIHVIGGSVLLAWAVVSDVLGLGHVAAFALWLASAALAMWSWRRAPAGALTWDGQHWLWTSGDLSHPVVLSVALDLQSLMLIQLCSSEAPSLWVWLERRAAPARWRPCRRAVFARRPGDPARDADRVAP